MALSGTEEQSLSSLHPAFYHYVGIGMLRVTKSGAEHTSKSGAEHTPCIEEERCCLMKRPSASALRAEFFTPGNNDRQAIIVVLPWAKKCAAVGC